MGILEATTWDEFSNVIKRRFASVVDGVKGVRNKRRLSFITIHYLYLVGSTIVGSILLFPAGGLAYIDALFFASGSSTQSGLNTVNVNDLNTYQQVVMYLLGMLTTPIFINTVIVFVRLYWFEKRFKNIVHEVRSQRISRSRSQLRSTSRAIDNDAADAEKGVNGRKITVLHDQGRVVGPPVGFSADSDLSNTEKAHGLASVAANEDSDSSKESIGPMGEAAHTLSPIPEYIQAAEGSNRHIAFVEEQRNPTGKVLRIPGPREADKGAVPEEVTSPRDDEPKSDEAESPTLSKARSHSENNPTRTNLTIEEPPRPLHSLTTTSHRRLPSNPYSKTPTTPAGIPDPPDPMRRNETRSMSSLRPVNTEDRLRSTVSYLSWQPTVGRNSTFFDLTEEQREELGGIEYRSLKTLAVILIVYYVGFHLVGIIILTPWIILTDFWGQIVDQDGQNRTWWAMFSSATFFNDIGFTLTPDSFISFQQAVVVLLLGSFLIVIGNTGFPCMLRFVIWVWSKFLSKDGPLYEEARFLLDHPRRCFTLLFPSTPSWILFGILVILNGIDLIFFIILDINDPVVTTLPPGFRFLDGLFQAFSTRTAGTACVNIAELHPGIQVSYLIMMYISVFPIAISVRRTNVYEERSLGIYGSAADQQEDESEPSFIGAHLRRQLSFDLWFIFLGLFIVAIADGNQIADPNNPSFSLFACLFEIVSAYGTVGLSLGYPGIDASFSAEFSVVSKLVIIAMQIRGRHRGLPYDLDRAILLPSESLHEKEEQDAARRSGARRPSAIIGRGPFHRNGGGEHEDEAGAVGTAERVQTYGTTQSRATHASGRESIMHRRPAKRSIGNFLISLASPSAVGT